MFENLLIDTSIHWLAVFLYILATISNSYGIIFAKKRLENLSYKLAWTGLLIHGLALIIRWAVSGHGPYMVRHEVLSSDAWIAMAFFLLLRGRIPKLKPVSIIIFPATFLLIAISLFLNPAIKDLPPTLRSIWLIFHVFFYKISLATLLIALAFSIFHITKGRAHAQWLKRLPDHQTIDLYSYRFAGFGFIFWGIAILAGSIWAFQSWGRFWGWDPIETWSLLTWLLFGLYLHLRRFWSWRGDKAAILFIFCFIISIIALFFTGIINPSVHSAYFT